MNKTWFTAVIFIITLVLFFGFSLRVFSVNPTNCEGLSCKSYATQHCNSECTKIGETCMGDPARIYGACIDIPWVAQCHSIWELRCENGQSMGQIHCYAYDPRCY